MKKKKRKSEVLTRLGVFATLWQGFSTDSVDDTEIWPENQGKLTRLGLAPPLQNQPLSPREPPQ
jgi:hypothetical protein